MNAKKGGECCTWVYGGGRDLGCETGAPGNVHPSNALNPLGKLPWSEYSCSCKSSALITRLAQPPSLDLILLSAFLFLD